VACCVFFRFNNAILTDLKFTEQSQTMLMSFLEAAMSACISYCQHLSKVSTWRRDKEDVEILSRPLCYNPEAGNALSWPESSKQSWAHPWLLPNSQILLISLPGVNFPNLFHLLSFIYESLCDLVPRNQPSSSKFRNTFLLRYPTFQINWIFKVAFCGSLQHGHISPVLSAMAQLSPLT
jgi:hypothetical protein